MFTALSIQLPRGPPSHPYSGLKLRKNNFVLAIWNRNTFFPINCVPYCKELVLCCSVRRRSICRVEKDSKSPTIRQPQVSDGENRNHWSDKRDAVVLDNSSSLDWGWLRAFPHVLTASIANFLFGYHIGVMNGPIVSIAHDLGFEGDSLMEGLVVSIFIVGAFFGSLSAGVLADRIGRRRTLQLDMLPLILGPLLSAQASFVNEMILGRFLVGLGIGVNTVLVPVYISEVSPTKYRGSLGTMCQLGTCVGLIVALVLGIPCDINSHWWRAMFLMASVPSFLLMIGMQFAAESPRWLGKVGRWDEARAVISQLWGESEASIAIEEIKSANNMAGNDEEAGWSELLTKRHYKAPAIGGILFILQQFAGINAVLYFSSLTFVDVGITSTTVASVAVGVANLVGASIAFYLMDKQGRRSLLLESYTGMAISMLLVVFSLGTPIDEQIAHFLAILGTLTYVFTFSLGAGPATGLIIPELSSTRTRAKTMAFSLCVHWVCNFVIGLFFLHTVEMFGLPLVYAGFGIVSLLATTFIYYYVPETKGCSLEAIEMLLNPDLEQED